MEVYILHTFKSKKLGRIVNKGEILDEPKSWVEAIEGEGFGKRVHAPEPPNPKRGRPRKKDVLVLRGTRIETASLEAGEE